MTPNLRLEPYNADKHYATLAAWWRARGDVCLPADVLPPTGAVVTRDGEPIAICAVWLSNARMGYVAFPITAPDLTPRVAYAAVEMSIKGAVDIAKLAGCRLIWGAAENRGVDRILRKVGFTQTTPLNNYFIALDPAINHDTLVGKDFVEQKG